MKDDGYQVQCIDANALVVCRRFDADDTESEQVNEGDPASCL
jgi:hypothetical protein